MQTSLQLVSLCLLAMSITENLLGDTFVYSHGFASTAIKKYRYIKQGCIPPTAEGLNYQDARLRVKVAYGKGIGLNLWDSCIGQEGDVHTLARHLRAKSNIVCYGESRGASTILNYLSSNYAAGNNVKGVVLDSPFDCMKNVIEHRMKRRTLLNKVISAHTVENLLPWVFWKYKVDGIQPNKSLAKIKREIPILFICSLEDTEVPWTSSANLYVRLRELGHEKVHILILPHGAHARIMEGQCSRTYRTVVNAFYKKYGIECDKEAATAGEDRLAQCQPTVEEIKLKLSLQAS